MPLIQLKFCEWPKLLKWSRGLVFWPLISLRKTKTYNVTFWSSIFYLREINGHNRTPGQVSIVLVQSRRIVMKGSQDALGFSVLSRFLFEFYTVTPCGLCRTNISTGKNLALVTELFPGWNVCVVYNTWGNIRKAEKGITNALFVPQ